MHITHVDGPMKPTMFIFTRMGLLGLKNRFVGSCVYTYGWMDGCLTLLTFESFISSVRLIIGPIGPNMFLCHSFGANRPSMQITCMGLLCQACSSFTRMGLLGLNHVHLIIGPIGPNMFLYHLFRANGPSMHITSVYGPIMPTMFVFHLNGHIGP